MDSSEAGILGVQVTLMGLFLVVFFESVFPYPLVGLIVGAVGTAVVFSAIFSQTWE